MARTSDFVSSACFLNPPPAIGPFYGSGPIALRKSLSLFFAAGVGATEIVLPSGSLTRFGYGSPSAIPFTSYQEDGTLYKPPAVPRGITALNLSNPRGGGFSVPIGYLLNDEIFPTHGQLLSTITKPGISQGPGNQFHTSGNPSGTVNLDSTGNIVPPSGANVCRFIWTINSFSLTVFAGDPTQQEYIIGYSNALSKWPNASCSSKNTPFAPGGTYLGNFGLGGGPLVPGTSDVGTPGDGFDDHVHFSVGPSPDFPSATPLSGSVSLNVDLEVQFFFVDYAAISIVVGGKPGVDTISSEGPRFLQESPSNSGTFWSPSENVHGDAGFGVSEPTIPFDTSSDWAFDVVPGDDTGQWSGFYLKNDCAYDVWVAMNASGSSRAGISNVGFELKYDFYGPPELPVNTSSICNNPGPFLIPHISGRRPKADPVSAF